MDAAGAAVKRMGSVLIIKLEILILWKKTPEKERQKEKNVPPPKDRKGRLQMHFVEDENCVVKSEVKGDAVLCMEVLEDNFAICAEKALKDAPIFIRSMFIDAAKFNIEKKLRKALDVKK